MSETAIPKIDPNEQIPFMNVDSTDFGSMSRAKQIQHFEVEGYVVLPGIITPDSVAKLKQELADVPMQAKSYSEYQTTAVTQPQWTSPTAAELIGYPPMIDFLTDLLGSDIIFTRGHFQRTHPGSPGISMHTDGQPYGSDLFGYEGSSPKLIRVLYYLDELTAQRSPFRIIPRSHLSYHADANPYGRYKWHPNELTLTMPAGSAVVIPAMLFHGTHPNVDPQVRELIQFGYRPAWAGPIRTMEEWPAEHVAKMPEIAQPFVRSVNTNGIEWIQPHKPANMRTDSKHIDPLRWE
jgi:hypothetical protein